MNKKIKNSIRDERVQRRRPLDQGFLQVSDASLFLAKILFINGGDERKGKLWPWKIHCWKKKNNTWVLIRSTSLCSLRCNYDGCAKSSTILLLELLHLCSEAGNHFETFLLRFIRFPRVLSTFRVFRSEFIKRKPVSVIIQFLVIFFSRFLLFFFPKFSTVRNFKWWAFTILGIALEWRRSSRALINLN